MTRHAFLAAAFTLAAVIAAPAVAQGPGGQRMDPKHFAERQLEAMKARLNLTAAQEEKVRPILESSAEKTIEARRKHMGQGGGPPGAVMREEMQKIQQETTEALGKVLTEEQMNEYTKMQEERRERLGGPGRGKRGPRGGNQ